MKRQPSWDKYEVALLIDAYIRIQNGEASKLGALHEVSQKLRTKAINEGLVIDDTFRNINGMLWQIGFIDCAFKNSSYGTHMPSKMFQSIVNLYQNERTEFEKVLVEAKRKAKEDLSINEDGKEEGQIGEMDSVKKDFAEWLSNKSELKYSVKSVVEVFEECSEYAQTHRINKCSIWDVESIFLYSLMIDKLEKDKIFKVVHKNAAHFLKKNADLYRDFLIDEGTTEEKACLPTCEALNEEDRIIQVVSEKFIYGFRLGSIIELMKLKEYIKEQGIHFYGTDGELKELIKENGFISNEKVFVESMETKQKLDMVINDLLEKGISIIYLASFYERNQELLNEVHITSEGVLKDFLQKKRKDLYISKNFISNVSRLSEDAAVTHEITRVWKDEVVLSVDEISERLPYIPVEKIKFYLSANSMFAWVSECVYTRVYTLIVTEKEEKGIIEYVNREISEKGFASLSDIPLGDIVEQNYELSETAILSGLFNRFLSADFYLNGRIITKEKSEIDAVSLMKQFCAEKDKCTLDEAMEKVGELTGIPDRRIAYPALYDVLVRVGEQQFVADHFLKFDVEAIDKVIDTFVKDGFAAIKEVTTFALFPVCGQPWTHYLLESYCYRYSCKYRYRTNLFNGRNAGAIVASDIDWDYKELLSQEVARTKIELKKEIIGHYLYEVGYMARSKFGWLDEIAIRAKQIREVEH